VRTLLHLTREVFLQRYFEVMYYMHMYYMYYICMYVLYVVLSVEILEGTRTREQCWKTVWVYWSIMSTEASPWR